jgi:hypothetical protein
MPGAGPTHSSASGHLGHLRPTAYLGIALRCSLRSWIEVSTRPCSSQNVRSCAREEAATAEPRGGSEGGLRRGGAWVEGVGGGVGLSGGGAHLGHARHASVLVANLAEHAALVEAGELAEVDGGLGVPVALEHAALARSQREHVAGTVEVAGHSRRARQSAEGGGAVEGRDPGRRAFLRAENHGAGVRRRIQHGRERLLASAA